MFSIINLKMANENRAETCSWFYVIYIHTSSTLYLFRQVCTLSQFIFENTTGMTNLMIQTVNTIKCPQWQVATSNWRAAPDKQLGHRTALGVARHRFVRAVQPWRLRLSHGYITTWLLLHYYRRFERTHCLYTEGTQRKWLSSNNDI